MKRTKSGLKAIETHYAGCRFRSRLEARWAVFFDTLGIAWEYEPEGYMIGPPDEQRPYLPDFWLPGERRWVEVKGKPLDPRERLLLVHATVTHVGWGLPDNENGILLLGGVPSVLNENLGAWHHIFEFYKGDVYRSPFDWGERLPWSREWNIACGVDAGWDVSSQFTHRETSAWNPSAYVFERFFYEDQVDYSRIVAAYIAARSARFEHGEHG